MGVYQIDYSRTSIKHRAQVMSTLRMGNSMGVFSGNGSFEIRAQHTALTYIKARSA